MTALTQPVAVDANRLRVTLMRLSRRLRQTTSPGITATQLGVLGTLDRQGPLTLGELAAAEGVQPPSITRSVQALEEKGLLSRRAVADDRRATRVDITPRARRLILGIRRHRNAWLTTRIAQLSAGELEDLERGLTALERILEDR